MLMLRLAARGVGCLRLSGALRRWWAAVALLRAHEQARAVGAESTASLAVSCRRSNLQLLQLLPPPLASD